MNTLSLNTNLNSQSNTAPLIGMPTWSDSSVAFNGVPLYALNQSYVDTIVEAGGIPFMIPLNLNRAVLWNLFNQLDGLFLAGGTDISPALYAEEENGKEGRFDQPRDSAEIQLARWALESGLPIFGICRGMQLINVAAGGSLYHDLATDLADVEKHDYFESGAARQTIRHNIFVESDSYLGRTLGEIVGVNSMHHQAIKDLGAGLQVVGTAPDGIIEAVEMPDHPWLVGLQWHPEVTAKQDETQQAIFDALVEQAKIRKQAKLAVTG